LGGSNEEAMGPRPHVLLLEDDPLALMMLTLELQVDGFEVTGAETAREAMAALDEATGLDAMVCDLDLRDGYDGYELARRARARHPSAALLYTSGVARPEFANRAVAGGGLALKPAIPQEIARRLHALLRSRPAG
jgi:DNA-binding response OmpR family regulator